MNKYNPKTCRPDEGNTEFERGVLQCNLCGHVLTEKPTKVSDNKIRFDFVFTSCELIPHPHTYDAEGAIVAFGGFTKNTYDDKGVLIESEYSPPTFQIRHETAPESGFFSKFIGIFK